MSIIYKYDDVSKTLDLKLSGRLDFASHHKFSEAYQSEPVESVDQYILDLSELTYLDSSALGMLLLLKDHVLKTSTISITNCSSDVYKIFEIANFNQLFNITKLSSSVS
ncbi:MAG: anti-anti-sigma factor [Oleiphilaceae bacterium]|jgi:anti-anti-sigma factor